MDGTICRNDAAATTRSMAARYLWNFAQEKEPDTVRRLEHNSFLTGLDDTFLSTATLRRLKARRRSCRPREQAYLHD